MVELLFMYAISINQAAELFIEIKNLAKVSIIRKVFYWW